MTERKGILLVISAPSGTGKTTLLRRLTAEHPQFEFSVSYTTRNPRPGEVHGREYYFCSHVEFEELIDRNFFAEWAKVHDNYYGTPRQPVLDAVEGGRDLLFDIDVQGAAQMRESFGFGCFVFLFPPSIQELRSRLHHRGTDNTEKIDTRVHNAIKEMEQSESFDYWVVNDNLEQSLREMHCILTAESRRPGNNPDLLPKIVSGGKID